MPLPGARYPMGIEPPYKAGGTWPVLLEGGVESDIYSARLNGICGGVLRELILGFC